jgi:hypothetical protein
MGTWGSGPFDNDAAADFIEALRGSPSRLIARTLRDIAAAPAGEYIDVDDGGAGWAACELVALSFGYGDTAATIDGHILDIAARLRPKEQDRLLALDALPRISDRANSELAGLWHEGSDGARFDAAIEGLRARLQAASAGPRALPKAKPGNVIALQAEPGSTELVAVQVVGSGEVAVFRGTYGSEAAALDCVKTQPAQRVPASATQLLRRGRVLGNAPLRKDLKGKKMYALEAGAFDDYYLMPASGAMRKASYDEARAHDLHRHYDENEIRALARGIQQVARTRSPDQREAEWCGRNAEKYATRRQTTTPGPLGDVASLERLLEWIEQTGIDNVVQRQHDQATGRQGYGRPNEASERSVYAFAGLVAIWRGAWPRDMWPSELAGRLPPPPDGKLMAPAIDAARFHADRVITRDAELRLIWDGAPDNGAALREAVASLQTALR